MKYFRIFAFLTLIFCFVFTNSCKSIPEQQTETLPVLPKIMNPVFESSNHGSEKMYQVSFKFEGGEHKPNEVVLFGVRKALKPSNIKGNQVTVNVIHQTQKIQGYEVIHTELANGIIFKIDGTTYLKTVDFNNVKNLK